jgi:hypothetical protein
MSRIKTMHHLVSLATCIIRFFHRADLLPTREETGLGKPPAVHYGCYGFDLVSAADLRAGIVAQRGNRRDARARREQRASAPLAVIGLSLEKLGSVTEFPLLRITAGAIGFIRHCSAPVLTIPFQPVVVRPISSIRSVISNPIHSVPAVSSTGVPFA